jgi:hypothetical protein
MLAIADTYARYFGDVSSPVLAEKSEALTTENWLRQS